MTKNIVVTGGAGFIGSHLVDKLIQEEANVTVVDNLSAGRLANVNKEAKFIKADVVSGDKEIKQAIHGKDYVFHLAASASTRESSMGWADPVYDCQINAIGTLNILRRVMEEGSNPKLIYASSAAVYGEPKDIPIKETHPTNPISPYGVSKLAGEKYCLAFYQAYGIKSIILRIFNTYGPRQPRYIMLDLMRKLRQNPARLEVLGTGNQVRDYCYVADTVEALILAAESSFSVPTIFNVAGGVALSIKQIAEKIVEIVGLTGKTDIYYTGSTWKGDITTLVADISTIERELGFRPRVRLEQGLQELRRWYGL